VGGFAGAPGDSPVPYANSYQSIVIEFQTYDSPTWNCPNSGTVNIYCYNSPANCANKVNEVIVPLTGPVNFADAYNACTDLAPIDTYLCARCEALGKCFDLTNGNSKASGDPHFVGFDGSRFNFDGTGGEIFNIISDRNFQLNSLFSEMTVKGQDGTWMTQIGMLVGNVTIVFSPANGVLVNGNMLLHAGTTKKLNDVSIEVFERQVIVVGGGYSVKIDVVGVEGEVYLNLDISLSIRPINPHGILGQTARNLMLDSQPSKLVQGVHRTLEGVESDYIVADGLLGTDFIFNRYGVAVLDPSHVSVKMNGDININTSFVFPLE